MNASERTAQAGSFESSDCLVIIEPGDVGTGTVLSIKSIVGKQFGEAIEAVARKTLLECGAGDVRVAINDRGALDFVIRSRILTALGRYAEAGSTGGAR